MCFSVNLWRTESVVSKLLQKLTGGYAIPYFTITPTFSICPVHGYIKGEHRFCPHCESEKKSRIEAEIKILEEKTQEV